MGHYASEMDGPPFVTVVNLYQCDDKTEAWAKEQLEAKGLKFSKIVRVDRRWITDDESRMWIDIYYASSEYKDTTCFVSIDYEEWRKHLDSIRPKLSLNFLPY